MFAIDTEPTPDRRRENRVPAAAAGLIGHGLDFLRRRFGWIAAGAIVGALLAGALAFATPNRYMATSQLLIDPRDLRVLQNEVQPNQINSDATVAFLESQARLIASDSIKRRVIERLGLAGDPDFGGPGRSLLGRIGLESADGRAGRDPVLAALAAMDKQIMVRRNERTFVIDVSVVTGEGTKSARVANAMVEAYLEDQTRSRSDTAQRASDALGSRLSELRERVRLAEDKVEKYRAQNNLVGASGKLVTEEQLAISSTQLTQARARTADAQAKFEQVRAVRPSSIESGATPEALQSQSIANLRAQLGSALTREADAQVLYGPQHPLYISAQAQVRDARRQIAEEIARIVQGARAEYDRARAAEATLAQQVERLKRDTLSTGQAAVQLRELEREADAHRQVFQAFLLRAREAGEQSSVDTTNARVITEAVAPLEKIGPNRKLFLIIGAILGAGLGGALALGLDTMPMLRAQARLGRASSAADAESEARGAEARGIQARELAARDRATGDRSAQEPEARRSGDAAGSRSRSGFAARPAAAAPPQASRLSRWGRADALADQAPARRGPAPDWLEVSLPAHKARRWSKDAADLSAFHGTAFATDSWDEPASPLARAIQEVRDRLAVAERPGSSRKVAVIGLQPGAGASLVALGLALAGAREGVTPLLIDLAAGPASLTAVFAADAPLGAEEVIAGGAGLIRAALKDDETGVFFLPRPTGGERQPVPDPARLSANLLDQTRRFDSVVIDGGAAGDGALPFVLAELADDIVLVAPASMSPEAVEQQARRSFSGLTGKIRAVVTNHSR